jgi:hypothetical protein
MMFSSVIPSLVIDIQVSRVRIKLILFNLLEPSPRSKRGLMFARIKVEEKPSKHIPKAATSRYDSNFLIL